MKRLCLLFCCLLVVFTAPYTALAASYTDDMGIAENNQFKSFSGLVPVGQAADYPAGVVRLIPGAAAVTLPSRSAGTGWVEYQVQNADTVTVGIYTQSGTFVSLMDGDTHVLGVYQQNMSHLSSQQLAQAQYSAATATLYSNMGSVTGKLTDTGFYYAFLPGGQSGGNLVDYGVNIYAGTSRGSLSRVSMQSSSRRLSAMQFDLAALYCYEEFTYTLPAGTTCVRIELNDFAYLDVQQGSGAVVRQAMSSSMRTTLSFVSFTGSGLVMGQPQPATPSSQPSEQESASSSSAKSSSSKASSKAAAAEQSSGTGESSKSSGTSTPKFQGKIVQSPSSPAGAGGKAKSSASSSMAPELPDGDVPPPEPEREPLQILRVEPGGGDRTAFLLALYIALVCGLILFLLLGRRGR